MARVTLTDAECQQRSMWAQAVMDRCTTWLVVPGTWQLRLKVMQSADDDLGIAAKCFKMPDYRTGGVIVMPWTQADQHGCEAVIHEMLHICFADLSQYYARLVEQVVPEELRALELARWRDIEESTVSQMARGLSQVMHNDFILGE